MMRYFSAALFSKMTKAKTALSSNFEPANHLTKIKGKDYLEVKWRLVWFRKEKPEWTIETEIAERGDGWVVMKAFIKNDKGKIIATGHKAETKTGFADYLEKAETGAVGRALAMVGYGTQFAPDFEEENRIVDAPVSNGYQKKERSDRGGKNNKQTTNQNDKGASITDKVDEFQFTGDRIRAQEALNEKYDQVAETLICPACGSEMWDNREDEEKMARKWPHFKCKNERCGAPIWKPYVDEIREEQQSLDDDTTPF